MCVVLDTASVCKGCGLGALLDALKAAKRLGFWAESRELEMGVLER